MDTCVLLLQTNVLLKLSGMDNIASLTLLDALLEPSGMELPANYSKDNALIT